MTVSFCPQCRYTLSITFDISFLVINLFIVSNGILELSGKYCARRNLPGVDHDLLTLFPSSSNVSILDLLSHGDEQNHYAERAPSRLSPQKLDPHPAYSLFA